MELFAISQKKVQEKEIINSFSLEKFNDEESEIKDFSGYTFKDLGLCDWICSSTQSVGYKYPTEIQRACIPAIISGRDVLACAETGSGKTAAFVLPILQKLSEDPFGIFSLVLTPTRELAIQISEQIAALGSALGVTVCLVIGGLNHIEQGLKLSRKPHFVIATPGRLRQHLESSDPPNLLKTQYLVLDEADRLLSIGFSEELEIILNHLNPKRKTLLFSATLTTTLEELEKLALKNALRFDLTKERKIPTNLTQEYLFMPSKVKLCYLVCLLCKILNISIDSKSESDDKDTSKKTKKRKLKHNKDSIETLISSKDLESKNSNHSSIIIFVDTCHRCHELSETLKALNIDCVALHSMLTQTSRLSSLGKFKSMYSRVLIATDVASRGLDIPVVDFVINFDLPRISSDYVHRIGRTARAGRLGKSISFITQYDITLLHDIEEHIKSKLTQSDLVSNDDILPYLNPISTAMRTVQLNILSGDFLEKEALFKKRKRKQKRQLLRKKKTILNEN